MGGKRRSIIALSISAVSAGHKAFRRFAGNSPPITAKNSTVLLSTLVVLSFLIGAVAFPALPAQIASHWNGLGQANGHMNRLLGAFLFPFIMLILYGLYLIIPLIDPMKANIKLSRKSYDGIWLTLMFFFLYCFVATLAWNLWMPFDFRLAVIPGLAALWYALGTFLETSKRSWFVGIRTPWTLSSDVVWEKTHRLAGKLFRIAAVLALASFLFPEGMVLLIVVPSLTIVLVTVVYSYVEYARGKHKPA